MNSFKEKLLRLKSELKTSKDKEIADILSMKPTAFAERKKTDSFPEKELFALKAKRPDLNIDVDYILLGHRSEAFEAMANIGTPMPEPEIRFDPYRDLGELLSAEKLLIQYFRASTKTGREALLETAKGLALLGMTKNGNTLANSDGDGGVGAV